VVDQKLLPCNLELHANKGLKVNIDLSFFKLGNKYITAFAKAIKLNHKLKFLNLRHNRITKKSASYLISCLP